MLSKQRSLVAALGIALGMVLGFQNCSGSPSFNGGAGSGPGLSPWTGDPGIDTPSGDPKTAAPLGDTKREVGGEGYTGKIFVQLGTCGEESGVVKYMVRINEDQTASVLKEDCQPVASRTLARNQFRFLSDGTNVSLTYTAGSGSEVTLVEHTLPALSQAQLQKFNLHSMMRNFVSGTNTFWTIQYVAAPGDTQQWSGGMYFDFYSAPTPTRLALYQCHETTGEELYSLSLTENCGSAASLGLVGYIEPKATADAPRALWVCDIDSGGLVVFPPDYVDGWCNPPQFTNRRILGYTPNP